MSPHVGAAVAVALLATASLAAAAAQPASADSTPPSAAWITLGTAGGPPLHGEVAPIANALVVRDAVYLFDVGNSVLRQLDAAGLAVRQLQGVFISHHHIDHNADLGLVMVQNWLFGSRKPLPVVGPPGTSQLVNGLVAAHAPTELASFAVAGKPNPPLGSAISAQDLPGTLERATVVYQDERITVSAISVDHYQVPPVAPLAVLPTAVAYRIEAGGRSFVYSGDTGPSPRLGLLAKGADVLVAEVVEVEAIAASLKATMPQAPQLVVNGIAGNMSANHLEPEVIGDIAEAAGVRQVVLTHYVPTLSTLGDAAALKQRIIRRYRGTVSLARDLDRF